MKTINDDTRNCENPGCGHAAEGDSPLCDSCALEWSLFHREVRAEEDPRPGAPPAPTPFDNAPPVS